MGPSSHTSSDAPIPEGASPEALHPTHVSPAPPRRSRILLRVLLLLVPVAVGVGSYTFAQSHGREALDALVAEKTPALTARQRELTKLQGDIHRQESTVRDNERRIAYLREKLSDLNQENAGARRSLSSVSSELDALQTKLTELEKQLADVNAENQDREKQLSDLVDENAELEQTRQEKQSDVRDQTANLDKARDARASELELSKVREGSK
jgi:chromosome segregation ATPase